MTQAPPPVVRQLRRHWARCVAARRGTLKLTQKQLAYLAGVNQQTISRLERGQFMPSDRLKIRLARALGTTPSALFPWPPLDELVDDLIDLREAVA